MNRINQLFARKNKNILSIYYTAGFPQLNSTLSIARHLQQAGADLIEIGIPFSDPLADGPTIQASGQKALSNGMTMDVLFEQLAQLRPAIDIPVLLMGYLNPVMQYGMERFCTVAQQVGIDGLILPDLPMYEYQQHYAPLFARHNLKPVFLITPQTSPERIRMIDKLSDAFIYMVSTAATTGARRAVSDEQVAYFKRIEQMKLKNPRLVGFGISSSKTYQRAAAYSSGAIVGSAFIKLLQQPDYLERIAGFVKELR